MLLQGAYQAGFLRQQFMAYGIPLAPLTLGHVQVLAQMGSKWMWDAEEIERGDLCMVLAVCCFPSWQQAVEELAKSDDHADAMVDHVLKHKDDDTNTVVEYLSYYLQRPKCTLGVDPMEARVPWWWAYAEFLQSEMGRSEVDAWDTICSDAYAYFAAHATRNGSTQYMTIRECQLSEFVAEGKSMADLFDEGLI